MIWLGPILFSIFPTLTVYSHNINEAEIKRIIIPLVYSLIFMLVSACVFYVLFRDEKKAAIYTSLWVLLFFSYGYIYLKMDEITYVRLLPLSINKILLGLYVLVLTLFGLWLWRNKRSLSQIITGFRLVAVTMVGFNIIMIARFNFWNIIIAKNLQNHQEKNLENLISTNNNPSSYPDIYYIIFDRYARQDVLQTYFNFDNKQILDYLDTNGFFTARKSIANYPNTFQSLGSSLNMTYLDFLTPMAQKTPNNRLLVYQNMIQSNNVARFLKEHGYRYELLGGFWDPTKTSYLADETINVFEDFDELQLFIYEKTLFNALRGIFESKQLFVGVERLNRKIINLDHKLYALQKKEKNPQPKFVFTHILMPHDPNIFSDKCIPFDFDTVRSLRPEDLYLDELQCANTVIQDITETIKSQTSKPLVIIFQSDEGPFLPSAYYGKEDIYQTDKPGGLLIHSGILNTIYMSKTDNPDQPVDYEELGFKQDSSPVNTFRIIFNFYFGTNLPLLENRTYYFPDTSRPYEWKEITDLLN
jgi:hypothetical protein